MMVTDGMARVRMVERGELAGWGGEGQVVRGRVRQRLGRRERRERALAWLRG